MDLGLKNRVAIVAASSQGLGKAVALGLAKEGARLALCARTAKPLEATAEEIQKATGAEVLARPLDVTNYAQVKSFVQEAAERFGHVDICVTNAGGPPSKTFAATSVEDWQAGVNLNLMSTLYFAREVLPLMEKQKWGRLIAITSVAVKQPIDDLILSNAVRSAVSGLIKSLANEYARANVLVNNVCPGFTQTPPAPSSLPVPQGSSRPRCNQGRLCPAPWPRRTLPSPPPPQAWECFARRRLPWRAPGPCA